MRRKKALASGCHHMFLLIYLLIVLLNVNMFLVNSLSMCPRYSCSFQHPHFTTTYHICMQPLFVFKNIMQFSRLKVMFFHSKLTSFVEMLIFSLFAWILIVEDALQFVECDHDKCSYLSILF